MMRRLLSALIAGLCLTGSLAAEHVIVTGGPALRKWEDLRTKEMRHDRWWANFVRASTIRIDQLLRDPQADRSIVWMIYRPGYRDRGLEDGKPYLEWIPDLARKRGVELIWFSSGEEFIRKFNQRPAGSVRGFDYFGHSNQYAFMFEYGSEIIASSTAWLHQDELSRIRRSVFHPQAVCTSWGCHTGQSMSQVWKRQLGVPLRGVKGPTNYTSVGRGELPEAKGPWAE